MTYKEYLAEQLDQIDYQIYISEYVDKTISYAEYISKELENLPLDSREEKRKIRKKKLERVFNR